MIELSGTYTEGINKLEYVCRVLTYKGEYYSCLNHPLKIEHGDVLYMLGRGTWFALYQTPERRLETLKYLEGNPEDKLPDILKPKAEHKDYNMEVKIIPAPDYSNMSNEDMRIDYNKVKWR